MWFFIVFSPNSIMWSSSVASLTSKTTESFSPPLLLSSTSSLSHPSLISITLFQLFPTSLFLYSSLLPPSPPTDVVFCPSPPHSEGDSSDSEVEDRVDGVKSWLSKNKGSTKNLSDDGSLKSARSVWHLHPPGSYLHHYQTPTRTHSPCLQSRLNRF